MKIVVQIVNKAKVSVDNKLISRIDEGYLLLVGFTQGDNKEIIDKMVNKLIGLRIFKDEQDKTNLSILDVNGQILSVSQFTLYADLSKGRRPSFINALNGDDSKKLYDYFNFKLKEKIKIVTEGLFGENMTVELINKGPFTIILDSDLHS